ncbi:MAG: MBOAT family O-acyltransferase, partial [Cyanobacteria bacterium J06635_13]
MLFSSFEFILVFLPITLGVFWHLTKHNYYRVALGWLILASLFFYAWWNPPYVFLLITLTLFNHLVSTQLCQSQLFSLRAKLMLYLGVGVNLGLLGYYKYAGFLVENINSLLSQNIELGEIVLPLGISFFTFQQIAYLVDSYQGKVQQTNLLKYGLFIFFFPQLIAGPIVHYSEILPQFSRQSLSKFRGQDLAVGSTIFVIGLAKKVILADGIALTANPIFHAADSGISIYFS